MRKLIYIIALLFSTILANGQNQEHFGMYMMHQPFFNPASMASYSQFTAAALYKTQWVGYEGAPKIGALNLLKPIKNSYCGLTIINDQVGIDNNSEIAGSYAYKIRMSGVSNLALGIGASINILQSNLNKVDILNVNDPTYNLGQSSAAFEPNVNFGTYYFNNKFYLGVAIPNLLENKISFKNGKEGTSQFNANAIHYYLHSGYRFTLNEKSDLNASTLVKQVSGASLQYDVNLQYEYNRTIGFGVSYRSSNEMLGIVSYQFIPELKFAYAYEYNFDEIGKYSSGSHEIMLIYQMNPPKIPIVATPRF